MSNSHFLDDGKCHIIPTNAIAAEAPSPTARALREPAIPIPTAETKEKRSAQSPHRAIESDRRDPPPPSLPRSAGCFCCCCCSGTGSHQPPSPSSLPRSVGAQLAAAAALAVAPRRLRGRWGRSGAWWCCCRRGDGDGGGGERRRVYAVAVAMGGREGEGGARARVFAAVASSDGVHFGPCASHSHRPKSFVLSSSSTHVGAAN